MDSTRSDILDRLLLAGAKELDITPSQFSRAVEHYEAVGKFLAEDGSSLERFSPVVFAQGSMAIGTATKPVGRDEFDLDLMCQLAISECTNPSEVKRMVGERLRNHATYKKMLSEKNRCWRLVYANEFYMDIIPGIPDSQVGAVRALLVPDKKLRCWKETDPKGYAKWFLSRAEATVISLTEDGVRAEVERAPLAPDNRQKYPLQVLVQLLKRHRDLMYDGDDDAPISIIITTLAARAYDGSTSIFESLSNLLKNMPLYVGRCEKDEAIVENPVNPLENFADKWATHPRREKCFYDWIAQATRDAKQLETCLLSEVQEPLGSWVGSRAATSAIKVFGSAVHSRRDTGLLVSAASGAIASSSANAITSPSHRFYGR